MPQHESNQTTHHDGGQEAAPLHLLLVEDDEAIRRSVGMALERYGYRVSVAPDGLTGLEMFREGKPDLLLLDVMLPQLDGIGVCYKVRETSQAPILMMSARGDSLDVVAGLEAGADDYVVKPVDTPILVARIRTLMRRAAYIAPAAPANQQPAADDHVLTFRNLHIDTRGLEVCADGQHLALTPTELRLLLEFVSAPGIVLERQTLLRKVWDYGWEGDSRVVDLAVQRLRKKIGADHIETVRGFGYKFRR